MSKKRQTNFLIGAITLVVLAFALFFSDDSSKLASFGNREASPSPDVYQREVIGESYRPTITLSPAVSVPVSSTQEQNPTERETIGYRVVKVVDGDTLDVDIDGKTERLRLIGIDTPETVDPRKSVQCFGVQASNKAKELLTGQYVQLESDESQGERDKYKRLLRYVILPDGTNFNKYMISEGYAHEYTYDEAYKYQADFKQAEIDARNANKGLWSPDTCSGNK